MAKKAKKTEKKSGKTQHVTFLLDETGSMTRNWQRTIEAVNEYFSSLKDFKDMRVTLLKFSDTSMMPSDGVKSVRTLCENVPVDQVPKLNMQNYLPQGMTPLHDASAQAILKSDQAEADQKLVTIFTDGMENCSQEHKLADVKQMVEARRETTTFTFLGADIDAYTEGENYGYRPGNTMATNLHNVGQTMSVHASATRRWASRGAGGQSCDFYAPEDKNQAETS